MTRQAAKSESDGITIDATIGQKWGWHTLSVAAEWIKHAKLDVVNLQFQTAAYNMHPAVHFLPERIKHIPLIVTFHDLRIPYLFPKAGPVRNWIVKHLASTSAGAIATDRADAATLSDHWHIDKVCWIPIGSNISTTPPAGYDRSAWRQQLGIGDNDLMISYFGFLNESKGALTLIHALKLLAIQKEPVHLIMIGGRAGSSDPTDYAYGERIDAAIASSGLADRVHWSGFVNDEEVTAHFYASDITALPYRDGVSLRRGTLMAALAHRQAIVTTTASAPIPELTNAVLTVDPDNPEALASAILALWNDVQQRAALQAAAHSAAAHFTWDSIARHTVEFYTCVINR